MMTLLSSRRRKMAVAPICFVSANASKCPSDVNLPFIWNCVPPYRYGLGMPRFRYPKPLYFSTVKQVPAIDQSFQDVNPSNSIASIALSSHVNGGWPFTGRPDGTCTVLLSSGSPLKMWQSHMKEHSRPWIDPMTNQGTFVAAEKAS